MDAIQFLEQEHEKAKTAFGKLLEAQPAERGGLWKALQPELKAHEELEEACLYGPIEGDGVADAKLSGWVSGRHEGEVREVEGLIEQTERLDPKEARWLATVRQIHDALQRHIREEEGEIFPRIARAWTPDRLEKAGAEMRDMKAGKPARR
jgi:hemerythrin-like domain-containing protein